MRSLAKRGFIGDESATDATLPLQSASAVDTRAEPRVGRDGELLGYSTTASCGLVISLLSLARDRGVKETERGQWEAVDRHR